MEVSSPKPPRGRPRDEALDAAILDAAAHVLIEDGYAALSIGRVAVRAGTSRPTVYRRYADKQALVVAALLDRHGRDPAPDTGNLEEDLLAVQRNQVAFFSDPRVVHGLLPLMPQLDRDLPLRAALSRELLLPRRASTVRALQRARARGDIAPGTAAHDQYVCDLLTGPFIFRAVARGIGPVDDELAQLTVRTALRFLRAEPAGA